MTSTTTDRFTIYCGDNRELYARVPAGVKVITDPPYGAEVHRKDRVVRNAKREVDTAPLPFAQLSAEDTEALSGFCQSQVDGWALIFCQTEQISEWRRAMTMCGDDVRYFRPMFWIKPDARPNMKGHGPGIGHETIMAYWCGKNKQRWNGNGKIGIFYHTGELNAARTKYALKHPTAKPVPLMKELVRYFTDPGDTIFDPFMGCGSTGVAALEMGRKFIGIEKNDAYYAEAKRRLENTTPGLFVEPAKAVTLLGDSAFGSAGMRRRLEREAREKDAAAS